MREKGANREGRDEGAIEISRPKEVRDQERKRREEKRTEPLTAYRVSRTGIKRRLCRWCWGFWEISDLTAIPLAWG
jgi:hypothetical protein